jgi:sulfur-carrier protein
MEKMILKCRVKAFGITREILGGREKLISCDGQTVAALKQTLLAEYPELAGLKSLFVAVNGAYAEDDALLNEADEIALIPPVSGG